jgi:transposase
VEEVTDEPLYRDRVCGIDIGKAAMVATIRVPSDKDPARRAAETRTFGTTRRKVLALADWLADAKQVKHLPGRPKRDPADSRWLAACFGRGSVRPCFVAAPEFRVIRLHTRYRRDLTEERARESSARRNCWNPPRSSCLPWSPTCTG